MSTTPLHVSVISAEHVADLPELPIVSRCPLPPGSAVESVVLDQYGDPSGFWSSGWEERLLNRLRVCAFENSIGYVVPGHPMLGDATMQLLLSEDSAGHIDLEFYDEPLPIVLTELLTVAHGPPAFIDALTLLDIAHKAPLNGGGLPLSTAQSTIVTNLQPGATAKDISTLLKRRFRDETEVRLMPMTGQPEQVTVQLAAIADAGFNCPCYLVLPPVSGDTFQRSPDDAQRLVARLRAPDGCPWDREQTNESLGRNLIEESYELLDAIETGNERALREELGDFLLQALMHAQISEEDGAFTLEDVIATLIDKLVRRHPHVFASTKADNANAVVNTWDEIKKAERVARSSDSRSVPPLGDIPNSLPALMRAQSVVKRSARAKIDTADLKRFTSSATNSFESQLERKIVEQILVTVQEAQETGVDAEQVVRSWTRAFEKAIAEDSEFNVQRR